MALYFAQLRHRVEADGGSRGQRARLRVLHDLGGRHAGRRRRRVPRSQPEGDPRHPRHAAGERQVDRRAAVHADNWEIDACPVNGPALSARGRSSPPPGSRGKDDKGQAFAAFSTDAGRTWGDADPARRSRRHWDTWTSSCSTTARPSRRGSSSRMSAASSACAASSRPARGRRRRSSSAANSRVSGYPRVARSGNELLFAWTESTARIRSGQQ